MSNYSFEGKKLSSKCNLYSFFFTVACFFVFLIFNFCLVIFNRRVSMFLFICLLHVQLMFYAAQIYISISTTGLWCFVHVLHISWFSSNYFNLCKWPLLWHCWHFLSEQEVLKGGLPSRSSGLVSIHKKMGSLFLLCIYLKIWKLSPL